jgi:hypothetical protein
MGIPVYYLRLVLDRYEEHKLHEEIDSWGVLGGLDEEGAEIIKQSAITQGVTAALWRKQVAGAKEHGHVMNAFDGKVDGLTEAFAEALDLTQYLMKMRLERGTGKLAGM